MATQAYIKDDGTVVNLNISTESIVPPATIAIQGISRIATQSEFDTGKTGANGPAFVTPEQMAMLLGLCHRWHPLALATPPAGFYAPTGGLISNADTVVPRAWDYLQTAEGATLCVTQAQWDADRANSTWGGLQGACSKYVLDVAAKTIRLPDIRGVALEQAGFDSLTVGGVRGDRMRPITAQAWIANGCGVGTGAFSTTVNGVNQAAGQWTVQIYLNLNSAALGIAYSGTATSGRRIGINYCVYLGTAE